MQTEPFTEQHDQLRTAIRRFVTDELAPHSDEWEQAGGFPDEVFSRMGELGFLGLTVPEEHGGQAGDYWCTVVLAEELSRAGCGGVPMAVAVQTDMATPPILQFGTEAQKRDYLEPAVRGDKIACLGITEPEAGSDVARIRTHADKVADGWVVNGSKMFITNGVRADFCTCVVRTSGGPDDGYDGISLFLLDTDRDGFEVASKLDKVGMRSSDTAELVFDDLHVPETALLGTEGQGFKQIMWELQGERLIAAVQAVAGAQRNFERAMDYAREREAFGRPIASFQVQKHRLMDMATRIEACRRLVYDCADKWNRGVYATGQIAQCKLAAAQLGSWVADETLQLFGGYGYSTEFAVERSWRDTRLNRIGGGSDEVQREIIAKLMSAPDTASDTAGADVSEESRETHLPLFGDEHDAFRDTCRSFVEGEIAPNVETWESQEDFPKHLFERVGQAGLFAMKFDERWAGADPDYLAEAVWIQELARAGSGGVAADLGAHSQLAMLYVDQFGDDDQKRRWLRGGIAGERVGALAITEPEAGSDVASIATRARRAGDGWVLDGSKVFTTNGAWCDWVVVAAKTDPEAGHGGITLFVVDADSDGLFRQRMKMLGWRTSHTGELHFDEVSVPDAAVLGEVGAGFYQIMDNFVWERLTMSLGAVAGAQRTLDAAIDYAEQRHAFGRPIGSFQVWRHRFADLATDIALGRAMTEHALRLFVASRNTEQDDPDLETAALRATTMAKLSTQKMAWRVADECVQVHGGYGYMMEYPAQRWWRDARLGPIGGGTDEIMKEILAGTYGL